MNPLDLNIDINSDDEYEHQTIDINHISNIFYPNYKNVKNKLKEELTYNNLKKHFVVPYLVCLKDDSIYHQFFNSDIITAEEEIILKNSIKIIPISYRVLTESMYIYLTTINHKIFNSLNIKNSKDELIITESDCLICCLMRFKYCDIIRYLKQYNGICEFVDLYNGLFIGEYLGQNSCSYSVKQNQIRLIHNMNESNYWTIFQNCKLNYTEQFIENRFNFSIIERLTDIKIENIIKTLSSNKEDNDYLEFLFKKANYVDASSAINRNGYKIYKITEGIPITIEDFNSLYDKLCIDAQYYLIMNCLISKDLCHLIVNNKYILNIINASNIFKNEKSFMQLYGQLFRYYLGYAWLTLYLEESIKKSYIKTTDRFVFDIDTAALLPWYPSTVQNLNICPYLPILISNSVLIAETNIMGVEQHVYTDNTVKDITRYGVCIKDVFIDRINQFISGKKYVNILANINWNNIAMTGSIMACCLPNYNTLMSNFIINKSTFEIDFIGFSKEYYADADVDIMCNITDTYEFVDKIREFNTTLQTNIKEIYQLTNDEIDITKIFTNKSGTILINTNYINIHILTAIKISYLDAIKNLNNDDIKQIVYKHYIDWHKKDLKKSALENPDKFFDPIYHEIFIPVPIEQINIILINPKSDQINDDQSLNIMFLPKINYKFRISSHYLPHDFEFFKIKYPEFFSTVSQFHLPIVRSYYDGNTVYLTPLCVTACITGININYKYFAGKTDPIEIINKYRLRGFGTILNKKEITRLIEYSSMIPKWKKLYKLNIHSNSSVMNVVGVLNVNNQFFKPSSILSNTFSNTVYERLMVDVDYYIVPTNQSQIIECIKQYYNITNKMSYDLITINKFGYVNPVKKWQIEAFYDIDHSINIEE